YTSQYASMASCSADTLGKSNIAAALLSPPYCLASAETLWPWQLAFPGVPANTGCANTQAAPAKSLSWGPPTMAVLPSAESETELPWPAGPTVPVPTSLEPCWLQTPLKESVNIHAAPVPLSLEGPPTMAVFPSPERDTEKPCSTKEPTAPVP